MANCCDLEENTFTPKLFLAKLEDLLIAGWGVMGGSGQILAKLLTGLLLSCLSENSLNKSICWPPTNIGHDPTVQLGQQATKRESIFLLNRYFSPKWYLFIVGWDRIRRAESDIIEGEAVHRYEGGESQPIRGQYSGHVITLDQWEDADMREENRPLR